MWALISGVFQAIAEFFGWKKQSDLLDAGKAAEAGDEARATLETAKAVTAPISDAERDGVWTRLQAERRSVGRVPLDPKPGP